MARASALIVIDGAHGEGGGALLRAALVMSALTQQPCKILDVRGGSRFQGLDAEDLTLLGALTESCAAETVGAELGSSAVSFLPTRRPCRLQGPLRAVRNDGRRGSSAPGVLAALLPVLARSGAYSSVSLEGETYGANSLSYDYFANVTLSALRRMGLYAFAELPKAGFGRESSGQVTLDVEPSAIQGVEWMDRGSLRGVRATVATSGLADSVGKRVASHLQALARSANLRMEADLVEVESVESGVFVTCWATYDRAFGGGIAMGARGVRAEALAQGAFEELFEWMARDATLDPFVADQVLIPMVLAEGPSSFKVSRLTQRFLTTVWVIKQFTPIHITVRGTENTAGVVTVKR